MEFERGLQQGKFEKEMELAPERINLRNENLKLRNNWYELKKWLEEGKRISSYCDNSIGYNFTAMVLDEMQKLENRKV